MTKEKKMHFKNMKRNVKTLHVIKFRYCRETVDIQ